MARRRAVAVAAPSRFPPAVLARLLQMVLLLAVVLGLVVSGVSGFLTYRIITARNDIENVTPATYLLSSYENLDFTDRFGGEHEGWLLFGLKGAPVIILCHGYNSNRSDLLSLGTALRENHFNVYLFNFRGPKTKTTVSDLGVRQASDLMAAIEKVTQEPAVNAHRVGLFGTTTGGYSAMIAAEQNPLVKGLVVDNVFESPDRMFETQLDQLLGGSSPSFHLLARTQFHLFTLGTKKIPVRESLSKLEKMPKLFILGRDIPQLASATEDLYNLAPEPKRLLVMEHSQSALASGSEKKEYEDQVLNFFLHNLPLRAD